MVNFNKDLYAKALANVNSHLRYSQYDNLKDLLTPRPGKREMYLYGTRYPETEEGVMAAAKMWLSKEQRRSAIDEYGGVKLTKEEIDAENKAYSDAYQFVIQPLRWAVENPKEPEAKKIIKFQKNIEKIMLAGDKTWAKLPEYLKKMEKEKSSKMRKAAGRVAVNMTKLRKLKREDFLNRKKLQMSKGNEM